MVGMFTNQTNRNSEILLLALAPTGLENGHHLISLIKLPGAYLFSSETR